MKRILKTLLSLTLVLATVLSLTALTAAAEEKKVLRLMVWGNTDNEAKTTQAVLAAYPDLAAMIDIEVIVGGANDAESANKFRLALSANDGIPDIVMLNYTQVPEFANAGVLEDISAVVEPYAADIIPGILSIMSYGDQMIAFPYDAKPKYWFYRADMFAAAGLDVTAIKTVEDLIAAGQKLQETYPGAYIWNLGSTTFAPDLMFTLTGFDAKFKDDAGKYVIVSDPGVRKTFEALKALKDAGVTGNFKALTPEWEQAIKDNLLASTLIASWFKVFLPNIAPEQQGMWGIAPWPESFAAGGNAAVFVVPAAAENKDLAMEFLAKMRLEKEGSMAVFNALGLTPLIKSCADDPVVNAPNAFFGVSVAVEDFKVFEDFTTFPFTETSSQELAILAQYLDEYLNGGKTLDEALAAAQNDMVTTIGDLQ